ncbi:hypothetical protein KJ765_02580 [Candidatus Micrarchaeota archaeon]|nr:hypothetical protein [Candidatus Micrarchaeota archaeon]
MAPKKQKHEEWRWPTRIPNSVTESRRLVGRSPEWIERRIQKQLRAHQDQIRHLENIHREKEAVHLTASIEAQRMKPYEHHLQILSQNTESIENRMAIYQNRGKTPNVEIRPLSNEDVYSLSQKLLRKEGLEKTQIVPHYGRSILWAMQAARHCERPWIVLLNGGSDGFLIIATKEHNRAPFVILSPEGKPRRMAALTRIISEQLGKSTRDKVIVKKANPFLELRLTKEQGFTDYRRGDKWDGKWPMDDDRYASPLISLEHVFTSPKPSLVRKLKEFRNSLPKGVAIRVENYHPYLHRSDALQVLKQWAPQMHRRTGEDIGTAIAAHQMYLRFKSTATHPLYMVYLSYTGSRGRSNRRIPFGFAAYEHIGYFGPGVVRELRREDLPRGHPFRNTIAELTRSGLGVTGSRLNATADKREKKRLGESREEWVKREQLRPVYAAIALITPTKLELPAGLGGEMVRQAGAALVYHTLQKIHDRLPDGNKSIVSAGGSETERLRKFRSELGVVGWLGNRHLLYYPPNWRFHNAIRRVGDLGKRMTRVFMRSSKEPAA